MNYKTHMLLLILTCLISSCDISDLFWDLPKLPEVETFSPKGTLDVSTICTGSIVKDGGSPIIEKGFCISSISNPTIDDKKVAIGLELGAFELKIVGLTASSTYYVRAYATSKVGTGYGNEVTFTTASLASLSTNLATSITLTSALLGGNITKSGGLTITQRGICFNTSKNPTISNTKVAVGSGVGNFVTSVSGLNSNTTYYVRAYAINDVGTAYGNEVVFTTASLPSLSTLAAFSITQTTAQSGGEVTNIGSSNIIERGICYGTNSNPTITSNKVKSGTGIGSFTTTITGLIQGVKYYVRAYATNSVGTAYGNEINFTTTIYILPTLTTANGSSIATNSAISGGNIISDGGATVTSRGICYGTTSNPTISNNKIVIGSGLGSFTTTITGLTSGTNYFVRAYATNSVGTAYGNQISFTTLTQLLLPTVVTTAASTITSNSATSGGNISSDGGATVTSRGICYSTASNPTIANNKIVIGSGLGSFTTTITGLTTGTTYFVRAYATNSLGTAYGNQINFTTDPYFTIGQIYQGGIIFYIDGTGIHGLIAAQSDQSSSSAWGCSGTTLNSCSYTTIGYGLTNTNAIVAGCNTSGIAARLCYDLSLSGYSDWYLPSKDELALMYTNLKANGLGVFSSAYYWSSTQYSSTNSYLQSFSTGSTAYTTKSSLYRVRAIRAF